MARDLAGRVAIVGLDQPALARRLAAKGAIVVLVGDDAEAAGALLAEIEAAPETAAGAGPGRVAFFRLAAAAPLDPGSTGQAPPADPGPAPSTGPTGSELDALVEFVASQWPAR